MMKVFSFVLILILVENSSNRDPAEDWLPPSDFEDTIANTTEFLNKYGYQTEKHFVTTEDGYILEVVRIPRPGTWIYGNGVPVLLVHGLLGSAIDFVLRLPKESLGTFLWDHGYDVWLLNVRGNYYSKNHSRINPENVTFWDFSLHEIALYDLPATIDYILSKNGSPKLHYIGHSQGAASFFAMMSLRPEYNAKIKSINAIAPGVFLKSSWLLSLLDLINRSLVQPNIEILREISLFEVAPRSTEWRLLTSYSCRTGITMEICKLYFTENGKYMDTERIPVYYAHQPAGISFKQLVHFHQLHESGNFTYFDYGPEKNKIKYGSINPPVYDLTRTTVPVALHYARGDPAVDYKDIERLSTKLVNLIGKFMVKRPTFNHIDYLFTTDSVEVYELILRIMNQHN